MTRGLARLVNPASIAIVGGGAWCEAVATQLRHMAYKGDVWVVHPVKSEIAGVRAYACIADLPRAPDAAFIGVNRNSAISVIGALASAGAGGAVCFASGFSEVADGQELNVEMLRAAGSMPVLGPNCYGFINAFDGVALWPDQHGLTMVDRGVAILTQSSNIAINLTMQNRALPIGMMITCGNQAQIQQAQIALALLDDPRITAIGLHIEGFGDLGAWQELAAKAAMRGVPLVALKVGRSLQAQAAAISHTASLAGGDAGAQAVLDRLGIARVDDLSSLIETLKILHTAGPLPTGRIATVSCSGGEASLAADLAQDLALTFPPLTPQQTKDLGAALGPKVTLANPLDYHTYIWRDEPAMKATFSAMLDPDLALTILIVDFPRTDRCDASDWDHVVTAALGAQASGRGQVAMCATLPELMPEAVAQTLMSGGVIPLSGLRSALAAIAAAVKRLPDLRLPIAAVGPERATRTLTELESKAGLSAFGVTVPPSQRCMSVPTECDLRYPVVLKGEGIAHKTESGAVVLGIGSADALALAATGMTADSYLIEEMVQDGVAELLVGVTRDPAHGFVLTLGAGGTLTEILGDVTHLLLPTHPEAVKQALTRLKSHKLLVGFRGGPAADIPAIVSVVMAIQDYVLAHCDRVAEVEINPLICTPHAAIAADALIRIADD